MNVLLERRGTSIRKILKPKSRIVYGAVSE
jgi:hypothetical protein